MTRVHAVVVLALLVLGCRGQISDRPPIHIVPDMDWQQKYLPQQAGPSFFLDGRAMRPPVTGTVAQGQLRADRVYEEGKTDDKHFVAVAPVEMTRERLLRGQERFNIYCAPCHDKMGSGKGMVVQRGYPLPVDLTSERVRDMSDGEVFGVISNGVRNMPTYAPQIPVEDRWNIVGWVRVLGRSQYGKIDDVPEELRGAILPEGVQP
ncbi:MAG: cytochrome c [Deltaproteobacteria bacterium]|nr:cytochrome c [Deltaproteobacteria bacterium]